MKPVPPGYFLCMLGVCVCMCVVAFVYSHGHSWSSFINKTSKNQHVNEYQLLLCGTMFHLSCCPHHRLHYSSVRTKCSLGRLISTSSLLFDMGRIGMKLNAFFPPCRDMHRGLNTPWQILFKSIKRSSVSIYRQLSIKGLQECVLLFCPSPRRIIF